MSEASIEDLQVKVAFLEDALNKLSDEHYQQQRELDEVKMKLAGLIEKLRSQTQESDPGSDIHDEKPPHY
ncbi:MAG: SlyX family protein [Pseudomonadota bacterium]